MSSVAPPSNGQPTTSHSTAHRVLGWAAGAFASADAVLLLGDFNADGSYFPRSTGG